MAFDVSALANYVKQNAKSIIAKQLVAAVTADIISRGGNVRTGVKSSEQIGSLDTDAVLQDGDGCGFNAQGSTKFSQRLITAKKMKVEEALCLPDLESKYTQDMLTAGVRYENPSDFDYNEFWVNRKIAQTALALEYLIWKGDTGAVDGQLNKINGFIKQLDGAAGVTQANAPAYVEGGSALAFVDATNIMKALDALFLATPEAILDKPDLTYFMGSNLFRLLKIAIRNSNYFHYDVAKDPNVIYVPGTELKIQRTPGLTGTDYIFGMQVANMVAGTDLESDFANVKVFYDELTELIKYSNKFKYGVNVGFTEEVVIFKPVSGE